MTQTTIPGDDGHRVAAYYRTTESRVGYRLLLRGARHFGYYEPGQSRWSFTAAVRQMEDQLAARLDLPAGSTVMDAGCGTGAVACRLAAVYGLRVHGVDLLDGNVADARRRAAARGVDHLTDFTLGDYSRERLESGSVDGVYTMETLVHVGDVESALSAFHQALRPGGRLVLFEYAHVPYAQMPSEAAVAFRRVNDLAAMPAFDRFEHGVLQRLLAAAGFADVTVEDLTDRMVPMLSAFRALARVPYALGRALRADHHLVNAMAAVEFWRHRGLWSYHVYSARKPGA